MIPTKPTNVLRGYYETKSWRHLHGQYVTIPKGAMIYTLRPNAEPAPAKRNRKVKIHHFDCGQSFCIGLPEDLARSGPIHYYHRRDDERVREMYGNISDDELKTFAIVKNDSAYLPIQDPGIVWAGSGSYWHFAGINDIPELLAEILKIEGR